MKMSRSIPYLGIVAAIAFGIFIATFPGGVTKTSPVPTIVIPDVSLTPLVTGSVATTSKQSTTLPKKIASSTPKQTSAPVAVSIDARSSSLQKALVNILCYAQSGSGLHSISASGVFIDAKGIVLTNAHVAQYFLLADRNISCTIRSGSPAVDRYNAALIYISPLWLQANPNVLTESLPNGTGEYDFALLAITKSTSTTVPLPESFPYLPLATIPPIAGTPIAIASYGAQFLESSQIQSGLFPTVVISSVKDIFTFATRTIDVLALGGSAAAQEGSSGGGVTDASGDLVATITTSTITGATYTRSLDAITASYIRAEYASETGQALDLLLAQPTATSVADFAPQIPALESIITANLP